jgi:hypothetical protein
MAGAAQEKAATAMHALSDLLSRDAATTRKGAERWVTRVGSSVDYVRTLVATSMGEFESLYDPNHDTDHSDSDDEDGGDQD